LGEYATIEFIDILGSTEQPKLMGIEDIEMFGGDSDSDDDDVKKITDTHKKNHLIDEDLPYNYLVIPNQDKLKTIINTLTGTIRNMQREINELRRKVNEHSITAAVKNDIISNVSYDQNIKYDIIAEPKNVSQQNNIEVISQNM
jgi:hypothetical protein